MVNANCRIAELIEAGEWFVVGLVLTAEGSTPREVGTKAVLDAGGRIWGTLGGGAVEAEAQRQAVAVCAAGLARVFEMRLQGGDAGGSEPICGGKMRVLVDPTAAKDAKAYERAVRAVTERGRGALLTVVRGEDDVATEVHWVAEAEIGGAGAVLGLADEGVIRACLAEGQARLYEVGEGAQVLIESVVPEPLLVIAGGGHVGQALAAQATLVGFDSRVIDDRPEFADPALFPEGSETECADIAEALARQVLDADTYVVIVTRGHQHDAAALRACIRRPAAYIGMIGSRRKVAMLRQEFVASGWATEEEFARVFAPIGLDIGAETVPEIAASIVAQLVAVRRRGWAARMPTDANR